MYMSKYAVILLLIFIAVGVFESLNISNLALGRASSLPEVNKEQLLEDNSYATIGQDSLLAGNKPVFNEMPEQDSADRKISTDSNSKIIRLLITAYSSSPEETDDTPFITASGSNVRPGVIAANFLPFGAKVRLPKLFGDQVFIVEDRLSQIHDDRVDIWFPSKEEAINFGQKVSEVEVL